MKKNVPKSNKESIMEYTERINEKIADRLELTLKNLGMFDLSEDELAKRIEKHIIKKFDKDIVLEEYYTFDGVLIMSMTLFSNYECEIKVYEVKLDEKENE